LIWLKELAVLRCQVYSAILEMIPMPGSEIGMLTLFVGPFFVFGGALAWACFLESRSARKKQT
jgi:hypothetical protein